VPFDVANKKGGRTLRRLALLHMTAALIRTRPCQCRARHFSPQLRLAFASNAMPSIISVCSLTLLKNDEHDVGARLQRIVLNTQYIHTCYVR
jgi:hypothetical protein